MNVSEIMTTDMVTLNPSENCVEASKRMRDYNIGDVLVQQEENLIGILTDRDIAIRCVSENLNPNEIQVGEILTADPIEVNPSTDVGEAAQIMADNKIRRLPVTEEGQLVGIVSLGDLAVDAPEESDVEEVLEDISEPTR